MNTPKHTKTPWMIAYGGEEGDGYAVIASKFSDRPVCTIEPRDFNTANAALIVRAVNAHEALVEALEAYHSVLFRVVTAVSAKGSFSQAHMGNMFVKLLEDLGESKAVAKARAALRAAKGEA